MNRRRCVDLLLRRIAGLHVKTELKILINEIIDNGEYYEGFDLAVTSSDLTDDQEAIAANALASFASIDLQDLLQSADYIKANLICSVDWDVLVITDDNDIAFADGLRLHRVVNGSRRWRTPRISYDGMWDLELKGNRICGLAYSAIGDDDPIASFEVDAATGKVLIGSVIEP